MARKNSTVTVASTENPVKRSPGRPAVYTPEQREVFSALVADKGAMGARAVLAARNGQVGISKVERANADLRKNLGFAKPLKISLPTLLKFAKGAGVTLKPGRRKVVEVSAPAPVTVPVTAAVELAATPVTVTVTVTPEVTPEGTPEVNA